MSTGLTHPHILFIYGIISLAHFFLANFFRIKFSMCLLKGFAAIGGFLGAMLFFSSANYILGGDFFFLKRVFASGVNHLNPLNYVAIPYFYLIRSYLIFMGWAVLASIVYIAFRIRAFKNMTFRDILQVDVFLCGAGAAYLTWKMATCMIDKDNTYSLYYLYWCYFALFYLAEPLYNKFAPKTKLILVIQQ